MSKLYQFIVLTILIAAAARADEPNATHITPAPQPPIQAISGLDLTPVRSLFNREADRPRILVMLSPT
ncbi:MAG: hypothetical protein E6K80_09435 [Candidatus Eisenbacteria bacterium]|uniref:Redoxin domain-containing protein n=1 Tax=Eiseniibacteriota bacterium TaxID=2212470 RepID=A0A538U2L1_UNCEI|nr:MAG: hypothetical protein E6K80_09435 [Candidatus Eisenbacteria bacterium]